MVSRSRVRVERKKQKPIKKQKKLEPPSFLMSLPPSKKKLKYFLVSLFIGPKPEKLEA